MKNKTIAGLLALFLGGLGIHQFYMNKPGKALIYLFFSWTMIPAIIGILDAIIIFGMSDSDFNSNV